MTPFTHARAGRSILFLAALGLTAARPAPAAAAAAAYRFEKVADSAADGFLATTLSGANINKHGEVAFAATRVIEDDGQEVIVTGAFRRNKNGTLTTIAEGREGAPLVFIRPSPTINDSGQVAFGAILAGEDLTEGILIGGGRRLTTVASTAGPFDFLIPGLSLNQMGEVAFNATLDSPDSLDGGLFSGSGRAVTTHYLASSDVLVDGRRARFDVSFSRPSINEGGDIAFTTSLSPSFINGVFVGQRGRFRTITRSSSAFFGDPVLNDRGAVVFLRADEDGAAIVLADRGRLTTVADTSGAFSALQSPSLNDKGDVVFFADLARVAASGIFTGPNAARDEVITTGDTLDGATVLAIELLSERAINHGGQIAFIAQLEDPCAPLGIRSVIFRATPICRVTPKR